MPLLSGLKGVLQGALGGSSKRGNADDKLFKAVQEDRSLKQDSLQGGTALNLQVLKSGRTLLDHACLYLNYPSVCVLLDKGLKPGTPDLEEEEEENKRNAYHWLVEGCVSNPGQVNDKFEVAKGILEELLFRPVGNKPHLQGPARILSSLSPLEQSMTAIKDHEGLTPLCLALKHSQDPLALAMLEAGFPPECTCPLRRDCGNHNALALIADVDMLDAGQEVSPEMPLVGTSRDNASPFITTEEPLPEQYDGAAWARRMREGVIEKVFKTVNRVGQQAFQSIPVFGGVVSGACKLAEEAQEAMEATQDSNDMVRRLCQRVRSQAVYLRQVRDTLQDRDLCKLMNNDVVKELVNGIPDIGRLFVRIDGAVQEYVRAFTSSKQLGAIVAGRHYKKFKDLNEELNDTLGDLGRLASQLREMRNKLDNDKRHSEVLARLPPDQYTSSRQSLDVLRTAAVSFC